MMPAAPNQPAPNQPSGLTSRTRGVAPDGRRKCGSVSNAVAQVLSSAQFALRVWDIKIEVEQLLDTSASRSLTRRRSRSRTECTRPARGLVVLRQGLKFTVLAGLTAVWLIAPPTSRGQNVCAAADALLESQLLDEADKAYHDVLKTHPAKATCVAEGLKQLQKEKKKNEEAPTAFSSQWWSNHWADVEPWLLTTGIALLLGYVLWRVFLRAPVVRLAEISGAPDDRKALGEELVAAMRDSIYRLRSEITGSGLSLVDKWGDKIDIPGELTGALPQGKVVGALLQLLSVLPGGQEYELVGQVRIGADGDTGLTLTLLSRRHRARQAVTLWSKTYDPPGTVGKSVKDVNAGVLGRVAAVWLMYELAEFRPPLRRWLGHFARWYWHRSKGPPLGTSSWESFALFSAGAELQEVGREEEARQLHLRALGHDRRNRGALFDLAVLDGAERRRAKTPAERARFQKRARVRLEAVREMVEEVSGYGRDKNYVQPDPLWYRSVFTHAAQRFNDLGHLDQNYKKKELAEKELDEVRRETIKLMRTTEYTLVRTSEPELRRFLCRAEEAALVLLAASEAANKHAVGAMREATRCRLEQDPGRFSYHELLAGLPKNHDLLAPQMRFNLASVYVAAVESGRAGPGWKRAALEELRGSLEGGDRRRATRAMEDATLAILRDDPCSKDEFLAICIEGGYLPDD
jgi:hypothetical protein